MHILSIILNIYQFWVIYQLVKGRLWCKKKKKKPTITSIFTPKTNSIMGKTKTLISHAEPSKAKQSHIQEAIITDITFANEKANKHSKVVDKEEYAEVFINTPMDIEIEADYQDEDDNPIEDEITCFENEKDAFVAKGVSFDEMNTLSKILQGDNSNVHAVLQAKEIADTLAGSELLEKMFSSLSEKSLSVVEALLDKNEASTDKVFDMPQRYQDFNIKDII